MSQYVKERLLYYSSCSVSNLPWGQVPGRPAENKTAELITMKDELGGGYKGEIKFGN